MQIKGDALSAALTRAERERRMAPIWVVSSDEPLLAIEAQDAVRATARALGFTERKVLHADARFDWSRLAEAAQSMSLFAAQTLIEVRLPTGKPGTSGAAALEAHTQNLSDDVVTLVALPRLEWRARDARWVTALQKAGVMVEIDTVDRERLPAWIRQRLARQQQTASDEALDFIADRVEGNLLAAQQEIAKLGLLYPRRELTLDEVHEAVLNVSRFDVFQLPPAISAGDTALVAKTIEGLRAEGEPIVLIMWAVSEELRTLIRVRSQLDAGKPYSAVAREHRLWGPREKQVEAAVRRLDAETLEAALVRAGDIDRVAKGLRAPEADSDAWLELTDLALTLAH